MILVTASMTIVGGLTAPPVFAQKAPAAPKTKTVKKNVTSSACAGLTQARCTANKASGWIKSKKAISANGRNGVLTVARLPASPRKPKKKAK